MSNAVVEIFQICIFGPYFMMNKMGFLSFIITLWSSLILCSPSLTLPHPLVFGVSIIIKLSRATKLNPLLFMSFTQ